MQKDLLQEKNGRFGGFFVCFFCCCFFPVLKDERKKGWGGKRGFGLRFFIKFKTMIEGA